MLEIKPAVLIKLGELSTERGGRLGARKAEGVTTPFTPEELNWLDRALREIIVRSGQREAGVTLKPLTMKDLPKLP